jgi:hypothetical protein
MEKRADKEIEYILLTRPPRRTSPRRRIKPCIALGLPAETGEPRGNDYSIAHNPR